MMTAPPIVGVPRLVWWRGRAVVADQLAVAPAPEGRDRDRRREQRHHESDQRRRPGRSSSRSARRRSLPPSRTPCTSSASATRHSAQSVRRLDQHDVGGPAERPLRARPAIPASGANSSVPVQPRDSAARRRRSRCALSPTTTRWSMPTRGGMAADRRHAGRPPRRPSSRISPSTAQLEPPARRSASTGQRDSAARTDSGLAL